MTYTAQDMMDNLEDMKERGLNLSDIALAFVDKDGNFVYGGIKVDFIEMNEAGGPPHVRRRDNYTVMTISMPRPGSW